MQIIKTKSYKSVRVGVYLIQATTNLLRGSRQIATTLFTWMRMPIRYIFTKAKGGFPLAEHSPDIQKLVKEAELAKADSTKYTAILRKIKQKYIIYMNEGQPTRISLERFKFAEIEAFAPTRISLELFKLAEIKTFAPINVRQKMFYTLFQSPPKTAKEKHVLPTKKISRKINSVS